MVRQGCSRGYRYSSGANWICAAVVIEYPCPQPCFFTGEVAVKICDAIYTRQSVDKADSISVESQEEFCRKEVVGQDAKVYSDKGYSGKNTERPAFQNLMKDVESGCIKRVIVYRLDRISRSVLDFANIIDVFQRHQVDFVSTMEKFDTGTPIGKAMLMIVMIFAQLERETIQQRITDAYASRSRRGFYMGGRTPYGFRLKSIKIDGIATKTYEVVEEEADTVKLIFSMYAEPQTSFGDIMRYLNAHGITKRDDKPFCRSRLRDMVVNPVYVKSDYKIYDFFRSQGTHIVNPAEDFVGTNGLYLYSGEGAKRKTVSLAGHTVVLAPHQGIVDSATWLSCRTKCLNNQALASPVRAKETWLAGKIKCGECGYALVAKLGRRKTKADRRYFICSHKYAAGTCSFGSLDADVVEGIVLDEMKKKLSEFETLSGSEENGCNMQLLQLKTQMGRIESEISSLLSKIASANETVMRYINRRVSELDSENRKLRDQIAQLETRNRSRAGSISNYMEKWGALSINDKITVVDCLIERIDASKDQLRIRWKI